MTLSCSNEFVDDENLIHRYKRGIILHQYALIAAERGDTDGARHLFRVAVTKIKRDAPLWATRNELENSVHFLAAASR